MQNGMLLIALWALLGTTGNNITPTTTTAPGGLYSSFADFTSGRLTYQVDCSSNKDKLKLNALFGASKGYVRVNGEKHSFSKNQVYGYRNCKNEDYRFYNNTAYQVLDTAGFFLYYNYGPEQPVAGKALVKTDKYYFSVKGDDALQPLTIANLDKAFPGNHRFHNTLVAEFKSAKELADYDSFLKTYRIKYLFSQSFK